MSSNKNDTEPEEFSGLPFLRETSGRRIRCPRCGNDGDDGSISGKSGQYGIKRICKKCDHTWSGGMAVQKADFSEPLPVPGIENMDKPEPIRYTGASFRDPSKNYDLDEE